MNDAEKNLLQQTYINASVLNTAITDGNIQQKKTISNWFASVAGRFLWATNILNRKAVQKNVPTFSHAKVLKIEVKAIREEEVYDLMIENEHEYFANGILVHNCMDATRYVVLEKVLGAYGSGMSASEILGIIYTQQISLKPDICCVYFTIDLYLARKSKNHAVVNPQVLHLCIL